MIIWTEGSTLSPKELEEFATAANKGIVDVEQYLEMPRDWALFKTPRVEFFLVDRGGAGASFVNPWIVMPARSVRSRNASYLHELAHLLTRPAQAKDLGEIDPARLPAWFGEGFSEHVARTIVRTRGGWSSLPLTGTGDWLTENVDAYCRTALASDIGPEIEASIGTFGVPKAAQPQGPGPVAPARRAFYACSTSYVQFLIDKGGLEKALQLFTSLDTVELQRKHFGAPVEKLKAEWRAGLLKSQ